jgi:hypothetical protein
MAYRQGAQRSDGQHHPKRYRRAMERASRLSGLRSFLAFLALIFAIPPRASRSSASLPKTRHPISGRSARSKRRQHGRSCTRRQFDRSWAPGRTGTTSSTRSPRLSPRSLRMSCARPASRSSTGSRRPRGAINDPLARRRQSPVLGRRSRPVGRTAQEALSAASCRHSATGGGAFAGVVDRRTDQRQR